MRRVPLLLSTLAVALSGCTSLSLRTKAVLTTKPGDAGAPRYRYEAVSTHSLTGESTLCVLTGLFYGGGCWAYLMLPDGNMIGAEQRRVRTLADEAGACMQVESVSVEKNSWSTAWSGPELTDAATGAVVSVEDLAAQCPTQAPESETMEADAHAETTRDETPPRERAAVRGGPGAVVAVFEIEDAGGAFDASVMAQLTEYLATRLTASGRFRVIPREQLRAELASERANSYRACYDQACQIELGKSLAAEKTVATKLLQLGKVCALTSTLFDLRTEAADAAATTRTECDEAALVDAVDRLVEDLGAGSP